jgi:hypothetical protein
MSLDLFDDALHLCKVIELGGKEYDDDDDDDDDGDGDGER